MLPLICWAFVLFVLTSLKLLKLQERTLVDEFTIAAMFLFMLATTLSFSSIRSGSDKHRKNLQILLMFFFFGLLSLFGITLLITFNFMKQSDNDYGFKI